MAAGLEVGEPAAGVALHEEQLDRDAVELERALVRAALAGPLVERRGREELVEPAEVRRRVEQVDVRMRSRLSASYALGAAAVCHSRTDGVSAESMQVAPVSCMSAGHQHEDGTDSSNWKKFQVT